METVIITEEDAGVLYKLFNIFLDARIMLIQHGSLSRENVSMKWHHDIVHLTFKEPVPKDHSKEV